MIRLNQQSFSSRVVLLVSLLLGAAYLLFVIIECEVETEFDITVRNMGELRKECLRFKKYNGRFPVSAVEMRIFLGRSFSGRLRDGWGNMFDFQTHPAGGLAISSFGADRKMGGIGKDGDVYMEIGP